jgi:CHAT domain-containing protein/tetratricopeptide (TPR) repeat protein
MVSNDTYPGWGGFWRGGVRKTSKKIRLAATFLLLSASLLLITTSCDPATIGSEEPTARQLRDKAYQCYLQFQYDSSAAYFRQAAALYREAGDSLQYHYCLNFIAEGDINLGDYRGSLPVLEEALGVGLQRSGGTDLQSAHTYHLLGYVYAYLDSIQLARTYIQKSIRIREEKLGATDHLTAASYYLMGTTLRKAGSLDAAENYLQKALDVYLVTPGPSSYEAAIATRALGMVNHARGEYTAAVDRYRTALTTMKNTTNGKHASAAMCHFSLAEALSSLGRLQAASSNYSQAATLYRDLYGEDHVTTAYCHAKLGEIYTAAGDYEYASDLLARSLQILLQENTESHSGTAEIFHMIGLLYLDMDKLDEAQTYCRKALSIHQSSLGENHPQVWQFHAGLARVLARKGEYDSALLHFARSLEVRRTTSGESSRLDIARIWLGTADVYRRMGLLDESLTALQKAIRIQEGDPVRNPLLWAEAQRTLGDLHRARSEFNRALRSYQQALIALAPGFSDTTLQTYPTPDGTMNGRETIGLLMAKAAVFEEWSDAGERNLPFLDAAVEHYLAAAELLRRLRRTYRDEKSKLLLADAHHTLYADAVKLCADLFSFTRNERYKELGFSFAEQGKAGILLDHITRARSKESAGVPDSLLRRERKITRELRFCETKIQKLGETDGAGEHNLARLRGRVISLHQARDELEDLIASQYPAYNAWKRRARVASAAELMEILDTTSCLIEYVSGSDRLYCFVLTRDSLHCVALDGKEECETWATALRRAIKTMNKPLYLSSAPELYRLLVEPIEGYIATRRHLIIIPDGFLHYLPFEALLRQDGSDHTDPNEKADFTRLPYLVRSHEISYAFSANFAVAASRDARDNEAESPSFAGFAPVFSRNNGSNRVPRDEPLFEGSLVSSLRSITVDGKTFNELPNSEQEVNTIIAGFRDMGYEGEGYFHSAATEENFKLNAGRHSYLHVATHGFINDEIPDLSALLFSDASPSRRDEDGILHPSEIMDLHLDASLLVLSSCESGIGRVVRGEGIMAMTRAFALAGADNIVCSLWKVYDSHSSILMQSFYRSILARGSYAAALREAKLELIKNPVTAFPMKWAGFVLVGAPLHPPSHHRLSQSVLPR